MKGQEKNLIPYSFFMLISPLVSIVGGIIDKGLNPIAKRWLLIIFVTFYGSVMLLMGDSKDHQERIENHYVDLTLFEFSSELYSIISFTQAEGTTGDVYMHVIGYFVGGILQMPGVFFVFVAFFYGFFYSGAIFRLLKLVENYPYTLLLGSFLLAFLTWKTVHDLQTVRTWTGLWAMFYGGLSFFETGKKKFLLILILPPLIHIGFFVMVIPVWVVVLFKNKKLIYGCIFLASFFTQIVPEQWALAQISRVPVGVNKIRSYYVEESERYAGGNNKKVSNDERVNHQSSNNQRFYKAYQESEIFKWGIYIPTFALLFFGAYFWSMTFLESSLFSTGLLAKALSNATFFLYALENRLDYVAGIFILGSIIILLARGYKIQNNSKFKQNMEKISLWAGWLLLAPYFVFKLAEFVNFSSFFLLLFPFIPWFSEINFSIKTFILEII